MRLLLLCVTAVTLGLGQLAAAQDKTADVDPLAEDLKLLQGKWELLHAGRSATLRSVKEIDGNRETLRRYNAKSGKLIREQTVEFILSRSGDVRVFTFYPVGGDPKQGQSFVYKVAGESFYDIPGLLQGDNYRNYQEPPTVWHWTKVKEGNAPEQTPAKAAAPPPEIEPGLRQAIEATGAKISPKANGYGIDVRRNPFFRDKELELIVQCPQVVDLTMEGVSITDKGLEKLRALDQLNRLILNDCSISADGLRMLAEMPLRETLLSIGLRGTKIKDDDLTWLKSFPKLERLDVSKTAVTDDSLLPLLELPLKVVNVAQTKVTGAGLEPLQKKNPKLVVNK